VIGGHSQHVSLLKDCVDHAMLTNTTAMKVHHEGFLESQAANLAGKTGLPYVDSGVAMSDMANGDESLVAQGTA
jgi:hypothetical protein